MSTLQKKVAKNPILTAGNGLGIHHLTAISNKLSSLVKNSFGVNGQLCLILQSTGHPLVTAEGKIILENTHFQEPLIKYITQNAISFQQNYGDGCKRYILLLNELLKCVTKRISEEPNASKGLKLSRDLMTLNKSVLPEILTVLNDKPKPLEEEEQIRLLIGGVLKRKFDDKLIDLCVEFLYKCKKKRNLSEPLHFVIENFPVMCVIQDSLPLDKWQVGNGFLIGKEMSPAITDPDCNVNFVLLNCNVNPLQEKFQNEIVFQANFENNLPNIVDWPEIFFEKLLKHYKELKIEVLISVERLPFNFLFLSRKLGLAVLHGIDELEADYIALVSGIVPITDVQTYIDSSNISVLSKVQTFALGTCKYTEMHFLTESFTRINAHYLVIGRKHYGAAILNALKVLKFWCFNDNKLTCVVGGRWEILLSQLFEQYGEKNLNLKEVMNILSESILVIPRTLFENSNNRSNKIFLTLRNEILRSTDLLSINGSSGDLEIYDKEWSLESVELKYCLIYEVISAVSQLLRIENIHHFHKS